MKAAATVEAVVVIITTIISTEEGATGEPRHHLKLMGDNFERVSTNKITATITLAVVEVAALAEALVVMLMPMAALLPHHLRDSVHL